ncbi:MAG: 6-phosphofructokinase [Bacteroidetes bacterium]|nr:6-phosphofructokinase [Bacteroidota bacterium]MBT7941505.1 6-phosphofructokinase [Candidatus Neomarinimicrobiota bacterium]MBT3749469.1 6-phosphofructokinase [Bacteroidota bacterium]MBT4400563.1 6-phosphofructokinase [Bacteroidota bacterium]MBT4411586.1 6-phosphofructokinase [Bacteroidota bacterium]
MKIGILTAGGDCPGLNAAIRGIGKTAMLQYGMRVFGFSSGFTGLIENDFQEFSESQLSGILTMGGTILGTSREKPFKNLGKNGQKGVITKPEKIKENYRNLELDCLVCIGGNGTMKTAHKLSEEGLNVVGLPKTIDNDVWGTDIAFGFDSAVHIATEALDRLHSTANSHKRTMVIEVMGHHAGWLALYAGIAGGGDLILLPEIPYSEDSVIRYLKKRHAMKKPYSIVVVAEGIRTDGNRKAARFIGDLISENTESETRETILGYIQRGGTPSPMDRILATRFGSFAAEMIADEDYGKMVALKGNTLRGIPLEEAGSRARLVEHDNPLIKKARAMGTAFGD